MTLRPGARVEDDALLRGAAEFAGDIHVPGVLHLAFVRSPFAHADVTGVDVSAARSADRVAGVYLASDLPPGSLRYDGLAWLLPDAVTRPALAGDRVRFVGEMVAAVVAEDLPSALEACELVEVEYTGLPSVADVAAAIAPGAPLLYPALGTNLVAQLDHAGGEARTPSGVTVTQRIVSPRMAVAPLEGNSITVIPEPEGRLTVIASTQTPHGLRDVLARFLGLQPTSIRVRTAAVGGGFGGKVYLPPEYAVAAVIAGRQRRPVRWVQQRDENLMTMHGRDHVFDVTLRADNDGRVLDMDVTSWTNAGAYPGFGCAMALTARSLATGPYAIPHLTYQTNWIATNTAPTGALRGAGRPEATHILERTMDVLAAELGLDPAELRRRNLLAPEQFPYRTPSGSEYDTGDYAGSLTDALESAGYHDLREEQTRRRQSGCDLLLGIGISTYVELSAAAPGIDGEYARVDILLDGRARATVGTAAHGQGHRTVYAGIVSQVLGTAVDAVDVVEGDTDLVPRGFGTGGSRSGQVGGSAVLVAARQVLEKARQLTAHVLEASVEDIEVVPGRGLGVRGSPSPVLEWARIAELAAAPDRLPPGMEPGLSADPGFQMAPGGTAPFGCHVAVVEVDPETGAVEVRRFIAVDDCGVVINPTLAQGQVHGGVATGIAEALYEQVCYDAEGNPLNPHFSDYLMPAASDIPAIETFHRCTPTFKNPLGAKGIGESGTTGSVAAVHNAVIDALAHLGIRHIDLPLSPARVWRAIAGDAATA
jgi:carbon-monoxide dehydrogenase large subunit